MLKRKGNKLVYLGLPPAAKDSIARLVEESKKHLRESDIEKHLVARVKALGGEVRKVQWIGRRGAPDRLVMLPTFSAVERGKLNPIGPFWVELKAPGVKPEAYQLREHERMRKMGQRVVVIDSIEGVEELLS